MSVSTPDLCDAYGDQLQVAEPLFRHFGGTRNFHGRLSTVQCHEDNSRVAEAVAEPGEGRVLVVDGGGSRRRSLLGDRLARLAADNGWRGVIIHGCLRDVEEIATLPLGVLALAPIPVKTDKRGQGERDVDLRFAGVQWRVGDFVHVDETGIVVSAEALHAEE